MERKENQPDPKEEKKELNTSGKEKNPLFCMSKMTKVRIMKSAGILGKNPILREKACTYKIRRSEKVNHYILTFHLSLLSLFLPQLRDYFLRLLFLQTRVSEDSFYI
jgi:hypothetical protein